MADHWCKDAPREHPAGPVHYASIAIGVRKGDLHTSHPSPQPPLRGVISLSSLLARVWSVLSSSVARFRRREAL